MDNENNIEMLNALNEIANQAAALGAPAPDANAPLQVVELQRMINNMVQAALNNRLLTQDNELAQQAEADRVDQSIEERFRANIGEIDRIPDVIRCLREFSGNPCEFSSWKKSVERILQIYDSIKGTPKYYGILSVIRNKIVGNADVILESYNTPLNWNAISKCLLLHYADKRDISTLEYELMSLRQGNDSVEEFYKRIYNHLSLILNKVSCMEIGQNSIALLTKTYRDKALDTFVRGLNGDLPRLLAIREPSDLPQALQLCQKLENQNFMNSYVNRAHCQINKATMPPLRKNAGAMVNQLQTHNNTPFFPQLAHFPQSNLQHSAP